MKFKKALISLMTIGAVAGLAMFATGAFFSDTETSTGNTLVAGAIDLKVDNECFYNGQACINGFWGGVPNASPTPTNTCSCTWEPKDLVEGDLFFDITDIKPGDYEEDTISLRVENNESWLCADIHLTSDDDVDCTDPENEAEGVDVCQNNLPLPNADGDLADEIRFLWWADDGDNVLEDGEQTLPGGPLGFLDVSQTVRVTLADSNDDIWGLEGPIPPGGDTRYIGKAWCFGDITASPRPVGDYPDGPAGDNNGNGNPGEPEDGGFTCDGSNIGNAAQTDQLTAEISFYAEQARHNDDFLCNPLP